MNVSSRHFVITTDVSTGFGVGCVCVDGLAKKASVFSRSLKLGNCCNKDIFRKHAGKMCQFRSKSYRFQLKCKCFLCL